MVRGMNVTGIEALVLLVWIVPVVTLYFVVRLAVRHGVRDVFTERDRMLQEPQPVAGRDRR